jgi:hypothetical protein
MDYGARHYDPYLNRFISPDTIVPDPANPQSLNRYAYVENNPTKHGDPSGHYKILMTDNDKEIHLGKTSDGTYRVAPGSTVFGNPVEVGIANYKLSGNSNCLKPVAYAAAGGGAAFFRKSEDNVDMILAGRATEMERGNASLALVPAAISDFGEVAHRAVSAGGTVAAGVPAGERLEYTETPWDAAARHTDNARLGSPHGNSKTSMKSQHGYEIYEISTGDVVKTGISGQPLNKNGSSPRANRQVNALNVAEGYDRYGARVVETGMPGRTAALKWERANASRLYGAGNSMRIHRRPRPWE